MVKPAYIIIGPLQGPKLRLTLRNFYRRSLSGRNWIVGVFPCFVGRLRRVSEEKPLVDLRVVLRVFCAGSLFSRFFLARRLKHQNLVLVGQDRDRSGPFLLIFLRQDFFNYALVTL